MNSIRIYTHEEGGAYRLVRLYEGDVAYQAIMDGTAKRTERERHPRKPGALLVEIVVPSKQGPTPVWIRKATLKRLERDDVAET